MSEVPLYRNASELGRYNSKRSLLHSPTQVVLWVPRLSGISGRTVMRTSKQIHVSLVSTFTQETVASRRALLHDLHAMDQVVAMLLLIRDENTFLEQE